MRHVPLALLLLPACSSLGPGVTLALDSGVSGSGCLVPADGGIFTTGLTAPVPGCAVPGSPVGNLDFSALGLSSRGRLLVVPATAPGIALPVVLVFHGAGLGAMSTQEDFKLEAAADGGAIVVYPNAIAGTWNIEPLSGDARRIDDILARLSQRYCIDPRRISVAGFSAGAVFALYLACNVPAPFQAVVSVAGTDQRFDRSCCTGTLDDVIRLHQGQLARDDTLAPCPC